MRSVSKRRQIPRYNIVLDDFLDVVIDTGVGVVLDIDVFLVVVLDAVFDVVLDVGLNVVGTSVVVAVGQRLGDQLTTAFFLCSQ